MFMVVIGLVLAWTGVGLFRTPGGRVDSSAVVTTIGAILGVVGVIVVVAGMFSIAHAQVGTKGGGPQSSYQAALTNTVTNIWANGETQLVRVHCDIGSNGSETFVQLFDALAVNVTLGTTPPKDVVPVLASGVGGFVMVPGEQYMTAISAAATTTRNGNTAPSGTIGCTFDFN